jgi:hypothetical protein
LVPCTSTTKSSAYAEPRIMPTLCGATLVTGAGEVRTVGIRTS